MINEEDIKLNLGYIVRELRIQRNITQEQLAEYLELQPRTISAIENGKSFVSSEVLASMANYFEVSPAIFFIPKINIYNNTDLDYIKEIKHLLSLFTPNNLKQIYNFLLIMLNK